MTPESTISCRVCNAHAHYWFSKEIFSKDTIHYYKCDTCGHVQSEKPYWLEAIYANLNFNIDTGIVDRSVDNTFLTIALARELKLNDQDYCIDYGAGTGLTVRYCRDHGLNMHYLDPYSQNIFANGFETPNPSENLSEVKLMTAFEVAEHLPDPINDFKSIIDYNPTTLFFSTWLYEGQNKDWWYFTPDGQHVSLYTKESLGLIAKHFSYNFYTYNNLHIFTKLKLSDNLLKRIGKNKYKKALSFKKKYQSKVIEDHEKVVSRTLEKTT